MANFFKKDFLAETKIQKTKILVKIIFFFQFAPFECLLQLAFEPPPVPGQPHPARPPRLVLQLRRRLRVRRDRLQREIPPDALLLRQFTHEVDFLVF